MYDTTKDLPMDSLLKAALSAVRSLNRLEKIFIAPLVSVLVVF